MIQSQFSDSLVDQLYQKLKAIFDSGLIEAAETNRRLMSLTVSVAYKGHVRFLCANVMNKSTMLNDVKASFQIDNYSDKEIYSVDMQFDGTRPEPFHPYFSGCFCVQNEEPHEVSNVFAKLRPEQVFITLYSGVRLIVKAPATQWLKQFEDFCLPNPDLPAKPVEQEALGLPHLDFGDWMNRRRW